MGIEHHEERHVQGWRQTIFKFVKNISVPVPVSARDRFNDHITV